MEENKNTNIEDVVESEEVMEVALDNAPESVEAVAEAEEGMVYTESEISGLTDEQRRRKEIFDKITTGILIALLCSPVAIILYIILWFVIIQL